MPLGRPWDTGSPRPTSTRLSSRALTVSVCTSCHRSTIRPSIDSSGQAVGYEQVFDRTAWIDVTVVTDRHGLTLHRLGALADLPKNVTC